MKYYMQFTRWTFNVPDHDAIGWSDSISGSPVPPMPKGRCFGASHQYDSVLPCFSTRPGWCQRRKPRLTYKTSRKKAQFFSYTFSPHSAWGKNWNSWRRPKKHPPLLVLERRFFFFSLSLSHLKLVRSHSWGWSLPLKRRSYTFGKLTWQTWTTLHFFLENWVDF